MNKKYRITGLILIVVLATIMISGCIGDDNPTNDKFTNEVIVKGETFYLPDGYVLTDTSIGSDYEEYTYSNGTNNIYIAYFTGSVAKILSDDKLNQRISNIKEDITYNGYDGYTTTYTLNGGNVYKLFTFEKNGKTFDIQIDNSLNFEEYIVKILR